MAVPYVRVQIAFASGPDDPVQQWTDVSASVRLSSGMSLSRGRSDEFANVEPGRASLVLDNTGGHFTYSHADGDHYPNVLPGKRVRVSVSPDDGVTWVPRFDGYVQGWPTEWAGGITQQPLVTLTATDRLARFGRLRTLRDAIHEELGSAVSQPGAVFG